MKAIFKPSKAEGSVMAPPSKSMAHRYLICAALAEGESLVSNISYSEDILATLDCISEIGAEVIREENQVRIIGKGISAGGILRFSCRECGSTLRFMLPIAMMREEEAVLSGSPTLLNRPMSVYEEIALKQKLFYKKENDGIHVKGSLKAGEFNIKGNISSQFISGLMFVLPLLKEDSRINLIPPVDSRSYIDLTIKALKLFGIEVTWLDSTTLYIKGNQCYEATDVTVEGDYSNAAFLEVLNTIGGDVKVEGLDEASGQGDKVYFDYFDKLTEGRASLDISDCPDLGPVLFVVAATNYGGDFTGTARLAIKESDRGTVMCEELSKFGIKTEKKENSIHIEDGELKKPACILHGHNDHRIVMALSTLLMITGGELDDVNAVSKSFPDYFERIKKLGIDVEIVE